MIAIKKDIVYTKNNYHYKNFISLSDEEKLMVLDWRNNENIRKMMYNQNEIDKENHFAFIQSLEEREDCFYWLVFKDEKPVGVFSLTDINYQTSQTSSGFYIDPYHGKEEIFEFIITYDRLIFEDFNVEKLYGGILSSNRYALLISLYMGTVIETEKYISGQKFLYGTLTRENYFKDIDKKENIKEFALFVRNYMRKQANGRHLNK
ncbi:MAG: UDP-4-amino-4,6-dideoxy-N-acetyl-beta-L-altrosamine N-acetyltransferase [Bacteroidales bacterium]|jgi:UDP-4-amino-4,6-dideoxy-N-acetyl-beta-L-altrosamine N-acetyltransferase|nr:UDP-4-amino-4,6-dideoxy-N-acetyl-beta-L-altrosamine N-acetyltransferase [Bacteroidales bacterium]